MYFDVLDNLEYKYLKYYPSACLLHHLRRSVFSPLCRSIYRCLPCRSLLYNFYLSIFLVLMPSQRRSLVFAGCTALVLVCVHTAFRLNRGSTYPALSDLSSTINPWAGTQEPNDLDHATYPLAPSVHDFFDQVFNTDDPPDFELTHLVSQCAAVEWQPNLYFDCRLWAGGLTTLMSQLKTCLHMTIEVGANLIIPTSPVRRADDLLLWDEDENHRVPLGECFDREFFIERLIRACPQMKVIKLNPDLTPEVPIAHTTFMNYSNAPFAWNFGPYATYDTPWKAWFKDAIKEDSEHVQGNIALKAISLSQFFDVTDPRDNQQLRWFELSHLMRAHELPRVIVHQVLESLKDSAGNRVPFFGVHFRVEGDVVNDDIWSSVDTQIERVWETVDEARKLYAYDDNIEKIIYLACGDQEQIEKFKAVAFVKGWRVIDKYSVAAELGSDAIKLLNELNFDRQAMIDLGVLIISDFFMGPAASAFSFTIAHDRSPTGRYLGSSLDSEIVATQPEALTARTHLFPDGGFAYQCCL